MQPLSRAEADLAARIRDQLAGRTLALLTGAGLSTDSGIPDYRGPGAVPRTPITYQQFTASEAMRRRYWARNHIGWRHMYRAEPNAGHLAAARLERRGVVLGLITQNVDRLHEDAGSENVVDLHGRFDRVICLDCGAGSTRAELAVRLEGLNPHFASRPGGGDAADVAPDADAVVEDTGDFVIAGCLVCGGILKPDFVFFGENVPRHRVRRSYRLVDQADALLVAGSSLTVMSGLRFVKHAAKANKPVVIINRGTTRGDGHAALRAELGVSEALDFLAAELPDLPDLPPGAAR